MSEYHVCGHQGVLLVVDMGGVFSNPLPNPETEKGSDAVIMKAKDALEHAVKAAGPDGPLPDQGVRITGQA